MTQRSLPSCPHCQSASSYGFFYAGRDHFHCRSCGLIFRPRSESEDDACIRHYREDYFKTSSWDQMDARRLALYESVICRIERERRPGSLLDVGCGRGIFLQIALRRGWSITGIDPSIDSIRHAEQCLGGRVFCATLDSMAKEHSYDVVTLINVLDHMLDLRKEMACAMKVLKYGGLLYLRSPNGFFHTSLLRVARRASLGRIMQRFVIFHQYSLTPRFIRHLLQAAGLSKISIHNSPFAGSNIYRMLPAMQGASEFLNHTGYLFARTLDLCFAGKFLIGPSLEVTAVK